MAAGRLAFILIRFVALRLKPVADNGAWVVDHGDMTSRGHWRDRLLGTLQGQLQLATYNGVSRLYRRFLRWALD